MLVFLTRRSTLAFCLLIILVLALGTLMLENLPRITKPATWSRQHHGHMLQRGAKACKSCKAAPNLTVTIVAARSSEDTSWLDVYLGRIHHMVYQVIDANAEYTTSINKGKEAMPYLQYIIDQYDHLPDISVFTHGAMCVNLMNELTPICSLSHTTVQQVLTPSAHSRSAWHLRDKVRILRSVQWGRHGFANLRHARMVCPEVWNCHHLGLDWRWSGLWLHPTNWRNITCLKVGGSICCVVKRIFVLHTTGVVHPGHLKI